MISRYTKEFYRFLKHIFQSRHLLVTLVKNDFKKQYLGSYFGLIWAFVQPLTFMLVIWFVFTYGFRASTLLDDTPFFLWLICGMIPWFFISNALLSGTDAITNNAFLVKKVAFRVSILPLVQIGSALMIHAILVLLLVGATLLYGYYPTWQWLQLPYYVICSIFVVLGISWITSSVRVFVKDVSHVMAVIIQIGFWATPIFWNITMIPEAYRWLFQLNPAYYIVEGFRNTFIYGIWFWQTPVITLYFLGMSALFFVVGAIVFKRLRPHFGDVL